MKYHVIYKLTNNINGIVYIGKHSTSNPNDGYMGSGIKIKIDTNLAITSAPKSKPKKLWRW